MSQLVLHERRESDAALDGREPLLGQTPAAQENAGARLVSGQLVQVLSAGEIARTLDARGRLDGLPFMAEMARHCSKHFRVYRRADMTCVEGHGLRRMRSTVFLQNVRCDGAAHDGCERHCLIFWKEAWLRPVADSGAPLPLDEDCHREDTGTLLNLPTQENDRYLCQSTLLVTASTDLPRWNIAPFVSQLRDGELTATRFA